MKDKDILKLLKKEVNSIMPNNYNIIKKEIVDDVKVYNNKLEIINESYSTHKKWVGILASCMLVVVAIVGVSLPFVLSKNRSSDAIFKPSEQQTESTTDDEKQDDQTSNDSNFDIML